jgi:hypothetical protein
MAFLNPSNQLLQIDTGAALTYLYNASQSKISVYAGIGENQVLGQRYFGYAAGAGITAANPSGSPAIYMLVQYKSTAQPAPAAAPAPVDWTDETYTTVSGVSTEGLLGLNGIAGYLMPNTTSIPSLTATLLQTALVLIQVSGPLLGALGPTSGTAGVGNWIEGLAGNFASQSVVAGTACGYRSLGVQATAIASGLCDVLVNCDII